ncbi:unnamed protein product [Strongylus vulgaris]|uniref:Vacuolar sorting protein 39/Transforming growth factor beta receptor-associated domain-containing protein n=1 Tax=Strongylus vulgaris TaxID=40348 RepID=A0A3P7IMP4_STRVU|nr:unnamed protein product [Strongylus vulgaris]
MKMEMKDWIRVRNMVTPYCAEDTIRWRIENGLLEEAWELACDKHGELEGTRWNSRSIGRAMIEHLISSGKPRQAAARMAERFGSVFTLCKTVCGTVSSEWEWAISTFERSRLCTLIAESPPLQFLPTSNPQLEPECYETVLQAALYNDVDLFKRLVQQWSPELYRTGQYKILQADEIHLYQALAHLYLHERKFDSALKIYLSLKDPQIFAVIDKYQLFEQVKDQVSELMRINTDRALRLLLDNEDNVPASLVMAKIARQPKLQMILLFGKSGKHVEALDLVIKKYNQLDKAIEYCQEHDDTDLWARLIEEVIETPAHIAYLLNHAGSSIDPLHVIEKCIAIIIISVESPTILSPLISLSSESLAILLQIPPTMPVPGLRDALAKVLRDYAAKVALQCGCQEATRGDVRELLTQHLQTQALPVYFTLETHCSMCGKKLVMCADPRGAELRMFGCGHAAHLSCCLEVGCCLILPANILRKTSVKK